MNLRAFTILLLLCIGLTLTTAQARAHQASALDSSTEIIVVTTPDWNAVAGTMQRYERPRAGKKWIAVGAPVQVVVGKNGLGWGAGAVSTEGPDIRAASDPVKKEGDGKAPAGVFSVSETFGYAAHAKTGTRLPYVPLTAAIECVDDTASKFYNRVIDRGSVSPDWSSSEHMLRSDELYRWGIVVDHNSNPPQSGAGSCIFMHIWRGPGQGTVGCTAMPQAEIESLLAWLDPSRKPLLVQMPEHQYRSLQKKWKLPALPVGRP
jgi:L,D-peptidoglycan transpeptidase YkuD (ErfK/YbiS/YcfS/YnhG family)